ncbi:hypothetical protein EJB05_21392 [Eragrostis curvula]|uniref:Uncharacterized protein n=1 Tax=Eragrostis curvula TaxID=38414 RepID=A0A5J9V1M7_9POAL|nr:hypothetical protein EJB05_21392 [Eragrostis curvula]
MHEVVAFPTDLNASPLPEAEDEQPNEKPGMVQYAQVEHVESAVETMRRERDERRRKLKREQQDEGSKLHSQQTRNDHVPQCKTSRHGRVKEAPQGWLECPAFGEPIMKIIPSKIGLVIDLTNTTRYYSPSELTKQGIKHIKIPCKGRDAVPDNESVNTFVYEVTTFLERHFKSPKYILVHCTHGHNRTGFMIIHYLMRTQVSHVTEAIHIFAQRRPPGIYKRDYIEALYSFYHDVPELTCPSTPVWKKPDDFDLNGEAKQDDDDNGDLAPPHGRGNSQFPGSHPVSLNSDNLQLLRQRYYYGTWKADGTRYMMLIRRDGCFLIDRNFCFRRVQMRFPHRKPSKVRHDTSSPSDTTPRPKFKRRYLAYDLMALDSVSKIKSPFSERCEILQKEIIDPRCYERYQIQSGAKSNPSYKYEKELFSVRRKDFWVLSQVKHTLENFIPNLCHDADGLIFQGWDDPYVTRTHEGLLKWKYPEMNSVDFLFEMGSDNRQLVFLYERGKKKLLDEAQIAFPEEIDPSSVTGRIVECSWNKEEQCWVMRSITDNITQEKLIHDIDEITRLPMYADRIARDQKIHQGQQRQK